MTQKRTLVPFFDACGQLGYHPQHVRKLVKGGKLKAPVPRTPDLLHPRIY